MTNNRSSHRRRWKAAGVGTLLAALCVLGLEWSRAQSPEKAKAASGIPFGEGPGSTQAAPIPAPSGASKTSARPSAPGHSRILTILGNLLPMPKAQNTVDDSSGEDATPVTSVRLPKTEDDIRQALAYAQANHVGVSMAGARHSEGGQIVYDHNVVLDMSEFNQMSLDKDKGILTVQSGAHWDQIQRFIDGQGLSLDVVQTHNIFSVGGSLSVDCHGSNPNSPPIDSSILSMRVMMADGSIVTASRDQNAELFHAVIGGYGIFGVILDVQYQLRPNELYAIESDMMDVTDYPAYFAAHIQNNPDVKYVHALLSTAPSSFLKKISVMEYVTSQGKVPPMDSQKLTDAEATLFNKIFFLAKSGWGQELFWLMSGKLAPEIARFLHFSRNQAMSEPLAAFHSNNPGETQILNEYFLPPDKFPAFVGKLRDSVLKHKTILTMAAARGVAADKDAMLAYAPTERMALVLFFDQKINPEQDATMKTQTQELIQAALDLGGSFYLPYQLDYSKAQLEQAYPNIDAFFALKRKYDPTGLFINKWYAKYGETPAQ